MDLDGSGEIDLDEFLQMMEGGNTLPDSYFEEEPEPELEPLVVCGVECSDRALFMFGPDNCLRKGCQCIVSSSVFEAFILGCILISCVCLALDKPRATDSMKDILKIFDYFFLVVFTGEMLATWIAYGFYWAQPSFVSIKTLDTIDQCWMAISGMFSRAASLEADRVTEVWNSVRFDAYLHNSWNQLDFVIVLVSWLNLLLSSVKFLKVLRLGRTLRPLRLVGCSIDH